MICSSFVVVVIWISWFGVWRGGFAPCSCLFAWVWWFGFGGLGLVGLVAWIWLVLGFVWGWDGLGFDSVCAGCSWLMWCLLLSVCYFVLVVGCGFWCFGDWLPCGLRLR